MSGDSVLVSASGDCGQPRPALVEARLGRIGVEASPENVLKAHTQIDKAMTFPRAKCGRTIGALDLDSMAKVDRSIALFFGLA